MLFKIYSGEIVSCSGIMARIISLFKFGFCSVPLLLPLVWVLRLKPVNVEIIQIVRWYILDFYAVQILSPNDRIVNTILRCQCP